MVSVLAENLKALRKNKGFKQAEVADLVGITDKNWSSYERGITEPNIATLAKIAKAFNVSTDSLINANVSQDVVSEPGAKYSFVPKVVTLGSPEGDNVVMVPLHALAGYRSGYDDTEFIQSLPSYRLPDISQGTFRMFELQGQSMVPTFYEGDVVVGRFVERFSEISDDHIYVLLTKQHGILIKRTLNRDGRLILNSDNQRQSGEYPPMVITPEDILEIWYITQYLSYQVRKSGELYARLIDLESRLTLMEDRERNQQNK